MRINCQPSNLGVNMCDQCLTNPIYFGDPLQGVTLARARRDCEDWKQREWGLIWVNDPSFIWTSTPVYEEDRLSVPEDFREALVNYAEIGWQLGNACVSAGWDPNEASLSAWLFNHLAKFIEKAEIQTYDDPFPHLEDCSPSDLSIGKE